MKYLASLTDGNILTRGKVYPIIVDEVVIDDQGYFCSLKAIRLMTAHTTFILVMT